MNEAPLKVTSGNGVKVDPSLIPEHEMNILARETLRAAEKYFQQPGVKEDYEKWLKEYKKRKISV